MRTARYGPEALVPLLRQRKIATMGDLKEALGTAADATVFRKLSELEYAPATRTGAGTTPWTSSPSGWCSSARTSGSGRPSAGNWLRPGGRPRGGGSPPAEAETGRCAQSAQRAAEEASGAVLRGRHQQRALPGGGAAPQSRHRGRPRTGWRGRTPGEPPFGAGRSLRAGSKGVSGARRPGGLRRQPRMPSGGYWSRN